jgi:hypothetical protein
MPMASRGPYKQAEGIEGGAEHRVGEVSKGALKAMVTRAQKAVTKTRGNSTGEDLFGGLWTCNCKLF